MRNQVLSHQEWLKAPADWLCLAAAPTFAIMALLTSVLGGGRWICCARPPKMRHRSVAWSRCMC